MPTKAVLGRTDLAAPTLIAALRKAFASLDLALEWAPGRAEGEYGGPPMRARVVSYEQHGSWVVLPSAELGEAISRSLGEPLVRHEAGDGRRVTYEIAGRERIVDIVDAEGVGDEELLHHAMGTSGVRASLELDVPLYPRGTIGEDDEPPDELDPAALADATARLGGASAALSRYDHRLFVLEIERRGATPAFTTYLGVATGEALAKRFALPRSRLGLLFGA